MNSEIRVYCIRVPPLRAGGVLFCSFHLWDVLVGHTNMFPESDVLDAQISAQENVFSALTEPRNINEEVPVLK